MAIDETFDLAIQLEEKMSECYKEISRLFRDESIAKEFIRLSNDETAHKNLLLMGKNYLKEAPDIFHLKRERISEMKLGLKGIIGLIKRVHDKKIDIEEALNDAAELERLFEQFHLKTVAEVKDASLKKLFEALSTDDKTHRMRLISVLKRFYRAS
jgi:rubrerythrin